MEEKIDIEKLVKHWNDASDKDFETMQHLFQSKDFHWALFMGHIVMERLLKAKVVKTIQAHAPFTHDLTRLAKLSAINFSNEHLDWLDTITTFNLNARYDSYKKEFYLKCTPAFTFEWIEKIKTIRTWIKQQP